MAGSLIFSAQIWARPLSKRYTSEPLGAIHKGRHIMVKFPMNLFFSQNLLPVPNSKRNLTKSLIGGVPILRIIRIFMILHFFGGFQHPVIFVKSKFRKVHKIA